MSNNQQARFFNKKQSQYPVTLITNPPYHNQQEIQQIVDWLQEKQIRSGVVDFGCGSGRVTIPLLKNKIKVLGIDLCPSSLENLEVLAKKLKLSCHLKTAQTLNESAVKAVVGADILHHLNQNRYLKLFYRSLRPKGVIAFSEPNYWNLSWHLYLRLFSKWEIEKGIKQCTYPKLIKALTKAGFQSIEIVGYGLFPLPLFNWSKTVYRLNIFLSQLPLLRFFSYRFLIFAQK